jgi:hypothetical protein
MGTRQARSRRDGTLRLSSSVARWTNSDACEHLHGGTRLGANGDCRCSALFHDWELLVDERTCRSPHSCGAAVIRNHDSERSADPPATYPFYNSGPVPYVVCDLRVRFSDEPTGAALAFHRVRGGVSPSHHPTPELSAAFPVAGRTAVRMFCEFERRPVGRAIEAGAHRLLVEGLTDKAGGWQELVAFDLNVSTNAELGMASQFISYLNRD